MIMREIQAKRLLSKRATTDAAAAAVANIARQTMAHARQGLSPIRAVPIHDGGDDGDAEAGNDSYSRLVDLTPHIRGEHLGYDADERRTLYRRLGRKKRYVGRSSVRVYRHNDDVYVEAQVPVMFRVRGGRQNGRLCLVTKLDPMVADTMPSAEDLAGVEFGAVDAPALTWWQRAKEWIKIAVVKAVRSPISALLAGLSLFMTGWGTCFVSAYVGARAMASIVGPTEQASRPGPDEGANPGTMRTASGQTGIVPIDRTRTR